MTVRASTALLIVSVVSFVLLAAMFLILVFIFPRLSYPNAPFPVEPAVVVAGSSVTQIVDRCASEWFGSDRLTITFTRNLAKESTTDRMVLSSGSNDLAQGCEYGSRRATPIPSDLPPGRYFIEITSTIYGRFRTATVYVRGQTFEVVRP